MRLAFILGEIGSGLRRNLSMVISVVLVTFVSLTFVGAAGMLQMQINQMKGYWYDKVQVAIFLCNDSSTSTGCASGAVTKEQQDNLVKMLESPAVKQYINDYQFESQADAFKHFKEQFSNSPIVDSVTQDQLPSSFRINMKDPQKYQIISETFSSQAGVETVSDQRQVLERIFEWMNGASVAAMVVAGVMIFCAVLLITTTIRIVRVQQATGDRHHAPRWGVEDRHPTAVHPRRRHRRRRGRRLGFRHAVAGGPILAQRRLVAAVPEHSVYFLDPGTRDCAGPDSVGRRPGWDIVPPYPPPISQGVAMKGSTDPERKGQPMTTEVPGCACELRMVRAVPKVAARCLAIASRCEPRTAPVAHADNLDDQQAALNAESARVQQSLEFVDANIAKAAGDLVIYQGQLPGAQQALLEAQGKVASAVKDGDALAARVDLAQQSKAQITQQLENDKQKITDTKKLIGQIAAQAYKSGGVPTNVALLFGSNDGGNLTESMDLANQAMRSQNATMTKLTQQSATNVNSQARLAAVEQEIRDLKAKADAALEREKAARDDAASQEGRGGQAHHPTPPALTASFRRPNQESKPSSNK